MAYNGIAWPGLELSMKAVNRERAKLQRWIKTCEENPKLYKRPKSILMKYKAMLADLDTGLQILRAAQKATERPAKRKRQKMPENPPVELIG